MSIRKVTEVASEMRFLCVGSLFTALCSIAVFGQSSNSFLIRDVRVFDGQIVLERRNVVVDAGKVTQITQAKLNLPGLRVVDGQGRTLLPGLFDAHVHISEDIDGTLRQALRFGVTTVLDMFNSGERLRRMKQSEAEDSPDVASLRTAGVGASVPGGHPSRFGGPPIPTITKPEQAQAFVDARVAEGSDYIKIIYDDNSEFGESERFPALDRETLQRLVQAAHKRHKMAVAHILSEQQAREAIAAGVDGIVHMFVGDNARSDFGQFAAGHHVFVVPTLTTLNMICGKSTGPAVLADPHLQPYIDAGWRESLRVPPDASRNHLCKASDDGIRQLIAAHVPILTGTDSPVPGNTYGASVHAELELLVEEGLTPAQALAAATSLPAKSFHISDRGFIRPGMRADLVLVEGNPTQDILATRSIVDVWKRGVRVQRQTAK
jgi:imidazolonepropionase-like amidohydrolase